MSTTFGSNKSIKGILCLCFVVRLYLAISSWHGTCNCRHDKLRQTKWKYWYVFFWQITSNHSLTTWSSYLSNNTIVTFGVCLLLQKHGDLLNFRGCTAWTMYFHCLDFHQIYIDWRLATFSLTITNILLKIW